MTQTNSKDGEGNAPVDDQRRPTPVRPTPIRRSLGVEPTDLEDPVRTVEIDDVQWIVRIAGEADGGRTHTNIGLVEIEFAPASGEEPPVTCLTVARAAEALSDLQLKELLHRHK